MPRKKSAVPAGLPEDLAEFLRSPQYTQIDEIYRKILAFCDLLPTELDDQLQQYDFSVFYEIITRFLKQCGLPPTATVEEIIETSARDPHALGHFVSEVLNEMNDKTPLPETTYAVLGNSPATYFLAGVWANMKRGREFHPRSNGIVVEYNQPDAYGNQSVRYKNKDYELTLIFEAVQEYTKNLSWTAHRLLVYTLIQGNIQNWKDNSATFSINDYMQWSGLKSRDATYRQLKNDIRSIIGVKITAESFKKYFESFYTTHLAVEAEIKKYTGEVRITFAEKVRLFLTQYYELIPEWSGQLGENAYRITFYLFYRARMDRSALNGHFNISIQDVTQYIGLPTKNEVKNRNYDEAIIRPFNKAIEEIERVSQGAVTFEFPHENINEFMEGTLHVGIDEKLQNYLQSLDTKRTRRIRQAGQKKKKDETE